MANESPRVHHPNANLYLIQITVLVAVSALILGGALLLQHIIITNQQAALAATLAAPPERILQSSELMDWEANYLSARQDLYGKHLAVTGPALAVQYPTDLRLKTRIRLAMDIEDEPPLALTITTGPDTEPLECKLDLAVPRQKELAAALNDLPAQSVTVHGIYRGQRLGRPTLNPCRLPAPTTAARPDP